ncbi:MAG: ATP-binding protein [Nocardioides sp.]
MTRARAFDLVAFSAYLVVAGVLGRMSVLEDSALALMWPAAGVVAAWFAVDGWSRWLAVDIALVLAISWAMNDLTGAGTVLAVGLALATVVQGLIFGALITRWCPTWWGFGTEPPPGVEALRDFGFLVVAAFLATLAAALLGPASVLSVTDTDWTAVGSWVLRNGTAIIAIFPLSLFARHAARSRDPSEVPDAVGPLRARGRLELAALILVTGAASWFVFVVDEALPVPFLLIGICVWAGTRFSPGVADVHALLLSGWVALATVLGEGPFAEIADPYTRAIVVQAFIAVIVVLTLALSVGRRESLLLSQRLATSEKAATDQAAMMRTILDTMADGVSVVDARGAVVLRNPASEQFFGASHLDDSGAVDLDAYGLSHPDGSPLTVEENPMVIALGGGSVDKVELVARSPFRGEEQMLEVTARSLPETNPPAVVIVFHDVTADRRERDELASFAGVVAHDLLNPLTIIDGWSEALREEERSPTGMDSATRAQHLDRIQRAALRMQHLISDLLAYTTARDKTLHPVRVDLDGLVREVARSRAEASRVADGSEPIIRVCGELPPVLAEPVLVRQVIDNLVGNAVKYVAPGVRPEVHIQAGRITAPDGATQVRLEVVDNGIGIPDGQHARVFDTFHRAHKEGYRGTGLGLSIVKRVVERHGGSVAARDRDGGGGTAMSVSFPAATLNVGPTEPAPSTQEH